MQVLPGLRFPDLVNDDEKTLADSFVLPDRAAEVAPVAFVEDAPARGIPGSR